MNNKVLINIKFIINGREFTAESEMIDWKQPIPVKGDVFDLFSEDGNIELIYPYDADKDAIHGNLFKYHHKEYVLIDTEFILVFMLGDW